MTEAEGRAARVDAVDRKLLAVLRARARATYAELGRLVGLSAPAVHERVRRLEDSGVITGYHAAVQPAAVDLGVSALVGISQSDTAEQDDVAAALQKLTAIEDCWVVAGDQTFVVRVRVADVDALDRILQVIRRVPGVARTRTTVVLATTWEGRPPLPEGRPEGDRGDGI